MTRDKVFHEHYKKFDLLELEHELYLARIKYVETSIRRINVVGVPDSLRLEKEALSCEITSFAGDLGIYDLIARKIEPLLQMHERREIGRYIFIPSSSELTEFGLLALHKRGYGVVPTDDVPIQSSKNECIQDLSDETEEAAQPNSHLLAKVDAIMMRSLTGRFVLENCTSISTLFYDAPHESPWLPVGRYKTSTKTVYINSGRAKSSELMAEICIHEHRHAWQYQIVPELFGETTSGSALIHVDGQAMSDIDMFIAMKLREADAWATEAVHSEELHRQATGSDMLTQGGYTKTFLSKLAAQWTTTPWGAYEGAFMTARICKLVESGEFVDHVSQSRFLEPEFLRRFCISPNNVSYFPEDRDVQQTFIMELSKNILTFHHPDLVKRGKIGERFLSPGTTVLDPGAPTRAHVLFARPAPNGLTAG